MQSESPAVRHTPLIHMILRRHFMRSLPVLARHGIEYDDLVQEGLYAILRAEPKFDTVRYTESTFYSQAIYNWIASRVCTRNLQMQKRRLNGLARSLDAPVRTKRNEAMMLADTLAAPSGLDEDEILDGIVLERALERLRRHSAKQYAAVCMRFYDNFDNYQIAAVMGCSIQYASLLACDGLKYLRGIYRAIDETKRPADVAAPNGA